MSSLQANAPALLAEAFRHAPVAMVIVRASDASYVDVNLAFERQFECTREEALSGAASARIWRELADRKRVIEAVRASGSVRGFAVKMQTFRGRRIAAEISAGITMFQGERCVIAEVREVMVGSRAGARAERSEKSDSEAAPASQTQGSKRASLPRGKGERILLVDDEEALCVSLGHLLTRLGYDVVERTHPQAALETFQESPQDFDMVLTDLSMPVMTGLELAEQIFAIRPQARVVLMSGFSGSWTPAAVRDLGLCDMLHKPVGASVLAESVSKALSSALDSR